MSPSAWWPTPVTADRWFSEQQREVSRRYHQPIERAVRWRTTVQLAFLVVLAVLGQGAPVPSLVSALLVGAAIGVPRIAADAWHEFVHEPRFGEAPVSVVAVAATAGGRLLVEFAALVAADRWIVGPGEPRPVLALAAFALPIVITVLGPHVVLAMHRASELPADSDVRRVVAELASAQGVRDPRVVELDPASFDGANAFVAGTGTRVTVAFSRRLLEAAPDLFAHVVSHELAHLRRRHLWWSAVASGLSSAVIVWAAMWVIGIGSVEPTLAGLILVGAVIGAPFRLALAWLSRAHERQADRDALVRRSVSPAVLKQLHLTGRPDLEPSPMARLVAAHPAPAERLEWVARHERMAQVRRGPETVI